MDSVLEAAANIKRLLSKNILFIQDFSVSNPGFYIITNNLLRTENGIKIELYSYIIKDFEELIHSSFDDMRNVEIFDKDIVSCDFDDIECKSIKERISCNIFSMIITTNYWNNKTTKLPNINIDKAVKDYSTYILESIFLTYGLTLKENDKNEEKENG